MGLVSEQVTYLMYAQNQFTLNNKQKYPRFRKAFKKTYVKTPKEIRKNH